MILEIQSSDKGILIPKIALQSRDNMSPLANTPPSGTLVFNTAVERIFPNNVIVGFYYWDDVEWRAINDTKIGKTTKYSNNTTNINFNSITTTDIVIFNTER